MTAVASRLHRSLTQHGPLKTALFGLRKLLPRWSQAKPDPFDLAHGTDTGGTIVPDESEVVGGNWAHGVHYRAVDPQDFRDSFTQLQGQLSRYSFVDLGCGKGRALILAWELGFERVYGVAYSERLVDIAERNCAKTGVQCNISISDVLTYRLPTGPLCIFMFNPFDAALLAKVVRRIGNSLMTHGTPLQITFDTLTLSPSLDFSQPAEISFGGHWHGFITNGEVK